ncbi:carboxypeptidase-like regulatory domain-containing protein [Croceiramulus getboli]|nr:carboxypeptidase-like regulatory domain-containing protein [Flavobacteriaceae bacterium YJPT1-3]
MKSHWIVTFLLLMLVSWTGAQNDTEVVVYYDTSLSMQERNTFSEFDQLQQTLSSYTSSRLKVVQFSNAINQEDRYAINPEDLARLSSDLQRVIYDGATDYSVINLNQSALLYVLMTDGRSLGSNWPQTADAPVFVINSTERRNAKALQALATATKGQYIDLFDASKEAKEAVVLRTVSGVVYDNDGPIAEATVRVRNTTVSTTSDSQGNFTLEAPQGAVLVVSFTGKKTRGIRIQDRSNYDINMDYLDENLEEVILTATSGTEEQTEDLGLGEVDKRSLGYAVQSIDEEEISAGDTDIVQSVSGQFSGINVQNNQDLSQFVGRGIAQSIQGDYYGLIVVDGVPMQKSNSRTGDIFSLANIDPQNVADITVLKGLAATNRWGTLGRNGVILIKTKAFASGSGNKGKEKRLGTTATYRGGAQELAALPKAPYIEVLKQATTIDEAYEAYIAQRKIHGDKSSFFLDVATYFKGWENDYLSAKIVSNTVERYEKEIPLLRATAYFYQDIGAMKEAVQLYEYILELEPSQAQSYRDLAVAYDLAGSYEKALELHNRIVRLKQTGSTLFNGLQESLTYDYKNLVAQHGSLLDASKIQPKYQSNATLHKRIVVEWNEPSAEFDLQIVNPQQRFFTWSHTRTAESQRMMQETKQGYALEEYFLTPKDQGTWMFNMKRIGDPGVMNQPLYVKITVYSNFGQPNQKEEIRMVQLPDNGAMATVLKIIV